MTREPSGSARTRLAGLLLLTLPSLGLADPGAVVWSGGTVRLMEEHPSVRLVSERIVIEPDIGDTRVTVDLVFENRGPGVSVEMGFPTVGLVGRGYFYLRGFNVEVDGTPLQARAQEGRIQRVPGGKGPQDGQGARCTWYLFQVPFDADGRRAMCIRYRQCASHPGEMERMIPYVLFTGGTWQGPVESVELEVRCGDLRNYRRLQVYAGEAQDFGRPDKSPLACAVRDDTLVWKAENCDGTPDMLYVEAWPGAVQVYVDGEARGNGADWVRWHHGQLLVEIGFLAELLRAEIKPPTDARYFGVLEKFDKKVPVEGAELRAACWHPGGQDKKSPSHLLFVDPTPAFDAFRGGVQVETLPGGLAKVHFAGH